MNITHPEYNFTVSNANLLKKNKQYQLFDDEYELERDNIIKGFEGEDEDEERDDTPSTRTVTESTYITDNTTPEGEGEGEGENEDAILGDYQQGGKRKSKKSKKAKKSKKSKKSRKAKKSKKARKAKRRSNKKRYYGGQPALSAASWTERDTYYVEPTFK